MRCVRPSIVQLSHIESHHQSAHLGPHDHVHKSDHNERRSHRHASRRHLICCQNHCDAMGGENGNGTVDWKSTIISSLQGAQVEEDGSTPTKKRSLPVKKLRKVALLSLQHDETDKKAKKQFKKSFQALEEEGLVSLSEDGIVTLKKKKKRKADKEEKHKKKKRKKQDDDTPKENHDFDEAKQEDAENDDTVVRPKKSDEEDGGEADRKPCKGNPQGITRLFLGNLPFAVDEASLGAFLPGNVTHIKWITDKETGKFYGSAFCEMDTTASAAEAVAKAGSQLMGRPIKINFAPSRPGDVWPPEKKVVSGGGQAGGTGVKAMSAKPENCVKLFIGNLSYDIDDDAIIKFFANVDAEVKAVRWLHHKDTGDFKGCGFVEFWNSEACDKGATLNGKNLLGRPIRIDWTD